MTPLPVTPEKNDKVLGLYYRVDVEAFNNRATFNRFMMGSNGNVVHEPENIDEFQQFLILIYGSNWEKRNLAYQTTTSERLYSLITGYGN